METSWQTFRESAISRQVDALIESDLAAYRKAHEQKQVAVQRVKNHQERRGSKPGVKRGPYKKHEPVGPRTSLASSKYYDPERNASAG